ncbi:hypothetical protein Esti_002305 [Eimeria stiedai]
MTTFGSLRSINVDSCTSDETAQTFGLKTSLKRARYVDKDSNLRWTVLSISIENDGCFFVEALFAAVLNKQRETRSVLHNLRKFMPSICSKRRERQGGGLNHQRAKSKKQLMNDALFFMFGAEVLRELVECPCNFIVVNPSAEHSLPSDLLECHVAGDLGGNILSSLGIYPSPEAQQQQHQQQPEAAAPRLSLLDKEQEEEESAVSQRQLLQLRAQQAFELSASRHRSQQQSESAQPLDTRASSMFPPWRASYPLGSTQATEREAWHTLQAE